MSYENTICEIDNDYDKIKDFVKDTLFINIYNFWCFANYLSMYCIWGRTELDRSKKNLKKKWISDLPNINLFIELVERNTEFLNPSVFYDDAESYFEKLFLLKYDLQKLIKPYHIKKKKKKYLRKCIR